MTANPLHPRTLTIPAHTTWRTEEGEGFRAYVATIPGAGETRIEVAWSGVERFEECVVGRVLGRQSTPDHGTRARAEAGCGCFLCTGRAERLGVAGGAS